MAHIDRVSVADGIEEIAGELSLVTTPEATEGIVNDLLRIAGTVRDLEVEVEPLREALLRITEQPHIAGAHAVALEALRG